MDLQGVIALGLLLLVILVVVKTWRRKRLGRGLGVGTGAAGAVYDLLSEDKRKAVEIIVAGEAEKRRSEHPDDTVK
ncbi:MAG TPA: hypothetical protein VJN96_24560 [Vicinamibacterales bacterium]|nr:hypothetical protein [Vicinamibacterales bacterium]